jgi:hypothetical protein
MGGLYTVAPCAQGVSTQWRSALGEGLRTVTFEFIAENGGGPACGCESGNIKRASALGQLVDAA